MKDFLGNDITIGDMVAVIYHPEAYRFSVKPAIVSEIIGKGNTLYVSLLDSSATPSYRPDASGLCYKRVVKISSFINADTESSTDAIGRAVNIGDQVVCMKLPEAGGNTVYGFELGGIVVKTTDSFVFYRTEEGKTKRKKNKYVVVC